MLDERENISCVVVYQKGKNKKRKAFLLVQNKALGRPLKLEGRLVVFFYYAGNSSSAAHREISRRYIHKWRRRRNERKSKENI